jgi:4a-hydroxytetrahydrobiopterin dehydratase
MPVLIEEKCTACRDGSPKVGTREMAELLKQVPNWCATERDGVARLERVFRFKDFNEAMRFSVKVADAADREDHHPALLVEWGRVTVSWWTHKIKGLHHNDFVMAAKTDEIYGR